jgi:hypothetical protein
MTCRKLLNDIETEVEAVSRDECGGSLLTARAVSGMKVARAQVGVLHGTWEPVALTGRSAGGAGVGLRLVVRGSAPSSRTARG